MSRFIALENDDDSDESERPVSLDAPFVSLSVTETKGPEHDTVDDKNSKAEPAYVKQKPSRRQRLHDPIFWVDLEMTGLDPNVHHILEVACIVTDGSLARSVEGPSLIIHQPESVLSGMNEWSSQQHGKSGLTSKSRESKTSCAEAEAKLRQFFLEHGNGRPRSVVLGGACVYVDLQFLHSRMPSLSPLLSHRVIDVSTVRALAMRWQPTRYQKCRPTAATPGGVAHRALDDIRYSIKELKALRDACWLPMERPSSSAGPGSTPPSTSRSSAPDADDGVAPGLQSVRSVIVEVKSQSQ